MKLFLPALGLIFAGMVQANVVNGTQGFIDLGPTACDGSPTNNINTCTTFMMPNVFSTNSQTGNFAGMPVQFIGAVPFSLAIPTSFNFADPVFGTFNSTKISIAADTPGVLALYILGNYVSGSYAPGASEPASFTLSLTQTPPGAGGAISASGTFSDPPVGQAPEPATMALIGSAVLGFGIHRLRKA